MVSVANRLAVVASRMVEVIGANGVYSSPIVKTTLINARLQKKGFARCNRPETKALLRHWYAKQRRTVQKSRTNKDRPCCLRFCGQQRLEAELRSEGPRSK